MAEIRKSKNCNKMLYLCRVFYCSTVDCSSSECHQTYHSRKVACFIGLIPKYQKLLKLFLKLIDLWSSVNGSWVSGSQVLTRDWRDPSTFVDPFDPLTHWPIVRSAIQYIYTCLQCAYSQKCVVYQLSAKIHCWNMPSLTTTLIWCLLVVCILCQDAHINIPKRCTTIPTGKPIVKIATRDGSCYTVYSYSLVNAFARLPVLKFVAGDMEHFHRATLC